MFDTATRHMAEQLVSALQSRHLMLTTAESCTGGLIAAAMTSISGSSTVMERGFVTYSNDAKIEVLGVMPDLLERHGAVSAEVAEAMAIGALEFSHAQIALSVTGIAGPTGGTAEKPVGLVYIGIATRDNVVFHLKNEFSGDRDAVREQAVKEGLRILLSLATEGQE